MNVLIGCEESGTACAAFRDAGHEAYSCDLLETRGNPAWHMQMDVFEAIRRKRWDLIILHPDCTALCLAGNGTYGKGCPGHNKRLEAIKWTIRLWDTAIQRAPRVVLENPTSVIFPQLKRLGARIQYVQPWMFGHPEQKKTGFALFGVNPLTPTRNVQRAMMNLPLKKRTRIHYMSPGENRSRDRAQTYKGMAKAFVQWTQ